MYERFAYVYDRLMSGMPYTKWRRFLQESWERYGTPASVVDLGCGTGELSLPLAELGYRVIGIDLSEEMLAVAREKAKSHSLPPEGSVSWLCQDMREWRLPEPVDCVFSFCDCLNYLLEEEDIRRTFRQTYEGLREGGLFVLDVHAPVQLLNYAEEQPFILDEEDVAYLWTCDYDPNRMQVEHRLTFFVNGEGEPERFVRFKEKHRQRAYTPDWLSGELRRAGFQVLDLCADFSWSPPDDDSERIFFVARKS